MFEIFNILYCHIGSSYMYYTCVCILLVSRRHLSTGSVVLAIVMADIIRVDQETDRYHHSNVEEGET